LISSGVNCCAKEIPAGTAKILTESYWNVFYGVLMVNYFMFILLKKKWIT